MATHTLGTPAANSLTAVAYSQAPAVLLPADLATVSQAIKQDNAFGNSINGAFNYMGILVLPGGRGAIKLLPGDVVAVDNTGWPIVVSAKAIADATDWTFT